MTLSEYLRIACTKAGFTRTELAVWLEYSKNTVNAWIAGTNKRPHPLRRKHMEDRIILLMKVLKRAHSPLPVPPSVTQFERKKYIEKVRDYALGRVSKAGSSA